VDNSGGRPTADENDGVTMADPLVRPASGGPWTIDDLPDDGYRYEIIDGSLLVPPAPGVPHFRVTGRLHHLLVAQAPTSVFVGENGGIALTADRRNYRIPDITVVHASAVERDDGVFVPADVVLTVEVVSPGSGGDDQVMKRYRYGKAGIPHYWIVDQHRRTLTVLRHNGAEGYDEVAVVHPGETWQTEQPFPIKPDPADFL
jgi:Uma2 family endonuclease